MPLSTHHAAPVKSYVEIQKILNSARVRHFPKWGCTIRNATTKQDAEYIRALQSNFFSSEYVKMETPIEETQIWKLSQKFEFTYRILVDVSGQPLGYYGQTFLHSEIFPKLKSREIIQKDLRDEHTIGIHFGANAYLHILDVYSRPDVSPFIPKFLFLDLRYLHQMFVNIGIKVGMMTGITSSHEGYTVCTKAGMTQTCSHLKKTEHGVYLGFFEIHKSDPAAAKSPIFQYED
jgi:hypothetical protein